MIKVKKISTRSLEENAYYHGVVVKDISIFKDWDADKAHQWVKDTFGIESTASLSTLDFENLMNNVRNHCEFYWKCHIPLPNK